MACPSVRRDNRRPWFVHLYEEIIHEPGLSICTKRKSTSLSEWIISSKGGQTKDNWQNDKSLVEANIYMLRNEVACDVTFIVGGQKDEIRAHKYMMMSRSPVLMKSLFKHIGDPDVAVEIPDVKPSTFRDMLTYMYTEEFDLHADNVTSMLYVAKKFALGGLSALCFSFLDSEMCVDNVCKILEQAHIYNESGLHNKCLGFILLHGWEVIKTPAFNELCPDCLALVIKSDDLKSSEEDVFEAVVSWATNECRHQKLQPTDETRRRVLGSLLYLIRFPVMDVVYFTQKVSFRELLSNDEAVSIFQYYHGEDQQLPNRFNRNERNRLPSAKPLTEKPGKYRNLNNSNRNREVLRVTPQQRPRVNSPVMLASSWSPNMSKVCRFRTFDGQWKQNGPPDAISFICSSPIVLYGVEIYGSVAVRETYNIKLSVFDDLKEEVRKNDGRITTDTIRNTFEVMLLRPVRVPPSRLFTVMVAMKGSPTHKGVDGQSLHVVDGVTFEFSDSNRSSNGTDVTVGQIPALLFNTTQ